MAERIKSIADIVDLYRRDGRIPRLGAEAVAGALKALQDEGYQAVGGYQVVVDDEDPLTVNRALGRGEIRRIADEPGAVVGPYFVPRQQGSTDALMVEDYVPNGVGVWQQNPAEG